MACQPVLKRRPVRIGSLAHRKHTSYDLISVIQKLCQQLPLNVTLQHVKAHQDDSQITVLPHIAWMNNKMDGVAKAMVSIDGPLEQAEAML